MKIQRDSKGNGWERWSISYTIEAHRQGWRGVWDALLAVLRREPRVTVPTPVTLSIYAKPGADVQVGGVVQFEEGPTP